jgi:hypothetical protein
MHIPFETRGLQSQASFQTLFLGLDYVIWNWLHLVGFTGSWLAAYAQSNLHVNQHYQTIYRIKMSWKNGLEWHWYLSKMILCFSITMIVVSHRQISHQHIKNWSIWFTFISGPIRVP